MGAVRKVGDHKMTGINEIIMIALNIIIPVIFVVVIVKLLRKLKWD